MTVETPRGSKNKYELSKKHEVIMLDRVLHSSVVFPIEYGIIPRTCYRGSNAMDAMVIIQEPTFPGCILEARPIGLLRMSDEEGPDDKVLCVSIKDPLNDGYADLADLPEHELAEVLEFFRTYKILEVGKQTEVHGWEGKDEGLKSIAGSMDRFERKFGGRRRLYR